jgi:hypothetical protein
MEGKKKNLPTVQLCGMLLYESNGCGVVVTEKKISGKI